MPRPIKRRQINGEIGINYFKPVGVRMRDLVEIILFSDEFEAIRLIDFEKISQIETSKKMQISQPTLSRILSRGRKKIADAIINGKAIKIEN